MNDNLHSNNDAESIDYDEIEKAVVRAINETENSNQVDSTSSLDDTVSFATGSDAQFYTVVPSVAPTTSAQQSTVILYDIRNLILLFFLSYLTLTFYRMLKTTINSYMGG